MSVGRISAASPSSSVICSSFPALLKFSRTIGIRFLHNFQSKTKPRILEVGTAVGFSSILMAEYDPVPCEIVTIENYEKRIPIARENFKRAGKEEQITLLEGDAAGNPSDTHRAV